MYAMTPAVLTAFLIFHPSAAVSGSLQQSLHDLEMPPRCANVTLGEAKDAAEVAIGLPLHMYENNIHVMNEQCLINVTRKNRVSEIYFKINYQSKISVYDQYNAVMEFLTSKQADVVVSKPVLDQTSDRLMAFFHPVAYILVGVTVENLSQGSQATISIRNRRVSDEDEKPGFYAR